MSPDPAASRVPLSIAIVTGSASRRAGGLFNSVRMSARALSTAGHRVTVLAVSDANFEEDRLAWAPLELVAARPVGPAALAFAPAMAKGLSDRFDVVHQHGIWQAFSTHVAAWRRRTDGPVMISPRGMLDPWARTNSAWKKRLTGALWERSNLSAATCLHALNASEAAAMRGFGLRNPIVVIPNGTDIPAAGYVPPPAWWPDGRVLLFVGRLHPKKGIAELIEAWARLSREVPDLAEEWRVVIAGWDDGSHQAGIEAKIRRHGLAERVVMPGPLYGADKDAALRHAEAFILPSHSEGLPMSVLEAWSYGLPVLMTEACNLPEGFAESAAFRIGTAPERLASELAQTLRRAPEALATVGRAGSRLVAERFSWDDIARRHAEVYTWMAAGAARDTAPCAVSFT